ncbi:MAG: SIS domain-containing protein [Steroidobacteraceae bacterium]
MKFPGRKYDTPSVYLRDYAKLLGEAFTTISLDEFDKAAGVLHDALRRDSTVFVCGNGGSAAIANHLVCDHQKGIHTGTHWRPKVISLSSNIELLTAVSNDIGFEQSFSFPLSLHGRAEDVLITISSSGNSENIINALDMARSLGMRTIAFSGFAGGRSRSMADASIHVDAHNYGVVEDVHQACMHMLAQYIRQAAMHQEQIEQFPF